MRGWIKLKYHCNHYYSCVFSIVGKEMFIYIRVFIYFAALEAKEGQEEVKVKVGQPALLLCQIPSTPPITSTQVSWQRGNTNVSRLAQESNRYEPY